MGTRREAVHLELHDDGFSTRMQKDALAVAATVAALQDLDKTSVRTSRTVPGATTEVDRLGRSANKAGPEIDRLSGRMRIFFDLAAVAGPSLVPIASVAVPALAGLASQAGFAAVGLGSLAAALPGVGDALKAINEAALAPTVQNLQNARQAMANLGPDAQQLVLHLQEFRPVLRDLRDSAAAGWFPGLVQSLDDLERVAPKVGSILEAVGQTGGQLVADGAEALTGPRWQEFLTFVEDNAPQALDELGRTLGNVASGLAALWQAFDPLNDDFSSWMLDASQDFAAWADGLSKTEGFAEFVDYIRENGPRVASAVAAVGNAVIELVEAIAPLGGPSLRIIETFANALATIADSDLGTPIMTGVAALALYNRTLQATAAIQKRVGISSAAGGAAAGGLFAAGRGTAAKGSVAGLRRDVSAMTAIWATAGARTERESARMSAAMQSARGNLGGLAKSAGPAAAGMALLAASTTDAGSSLLDTNGAMLGLMGTMAGPWGALIGATVGNLMDFKAQLSEIDKIVETSDQRLANSALQKRKDAFTNPISWLTGATGTQAAEDVWSKITTGESASSKLVKEAGSWGSAGNMLEEQARVEAMQNAEAAEMGMSVATASLARNLHLTNAEMLAGLQAIEARTAAANGAFSAETQWREALKAATEQANKNNAGIKGNSEAALANRQALEGLSSAWKNQRDAMVDAGKTPAQVAAKYRTAKKAFIETATAMGVPIQAARRLARELLAIPEKRATKIVVDAQQAIGDVHNVQAAINALKGKKITIQVVRDMGNLTRRADAADARPNGEMPADGGTIPLGGGRPIRSAAGSTVPDDGGPYADRFPYLLAPLEEVVTNRSGEADLFRPELKDINAGLTRREVFERMLARGLADGGTVASLSRGLAQGGTARNGAWFGPGIVPGFAKIPGLDLSAIHLANLSFKELNRALHRTQAALKREAETRDAATKAENLRSAITSRFQSTLYEDGGSVWSNGGGIAGDIATLRRDIADADMFEANRQKLEALGLNGPALTDLLSNASNQKIAQYAASTPADIALFEQLYDQRAAKATAYAETAVQAIYGKQLTELREANRRLAALEKAVDRSKEQNSREQDKNRQQQHKGATKAAKGKDRGTLRTGAGR